MFWCQSLNFPDPVHAPLFVRQASAQSQRKACRRRRRRVLWKWKEETVRWCVGHHPCVFVTSLCVRFSSESRCRFTELQDQVELTRIEEGTTQLKKIALGMNDVRKQCRWTAHAFL